MLNDVACFKTVYIVCGYTDFRSGMDRLTAMIEAHTGQLPCIPDTSVSFLRQAIRLDQRAGLGRGWLLLYKRLADGRFQWPRSEAEVQSLTPQQFRWLMKGLTLSPSKAVKRIYVKSSGGGALGLFSLFYFRRKAMVY